MRAWPFEALAARYNHLVFCMTRIVGHGRWRFVLALACGLEAGACTVKEPANTQVECLAGEPCGGDAAAETQPEVRVGPDARVEPVSSAQEAGVAPSCPGLCNPEDVRACLAPVLQELATNDGGTLGAGIAAPARDASLADGVEATDAGGKSQGQTGLLTEAGAPSSGASSDASPESSMSLPTGVAPDADVATGDAGEGRLDVLDAAAGQEPDNSTPVIACQLTLRSGEVGAECAQGGGGDEGDACASARDCAPGFGCVGAAGAAQCLPYCCGGNDSCGSGRYCTQRPLRSPELQDAKSTPTIPVCAVADNCSLMLGPCTEPGACSCPEGLACTIVRADTTTCVEPGAGREGESCPCAQGYFCSQGTSTCLKFCNPNDPAGGCGERQCQPGPSGFPAGWGLCVDG